MSRLYSFVTLGCLLAWPVIPLFWIPVHGAPGLRRRLGPLMYPVALALWTPWAWLVIRHGGPLLHHTLPWPSWVRWAGWPLFMAGICLQTWTAILMGRKIIGLPELMPDQGAGLVQSPPFNWCRHPTYLSHHLIFAGAAMITREAACLAVALLDVAVTQLVIIPLEEQELRQRFGEAYDRYVAGTPRIIPWARRRRRRG